MPVKFQVEVLTQRVRDVVQVKARPVTMHKALPPNTPKPKQIREKRRTSFNWNRQWQVDLTITKPVGDVAHSG